MRNKAKNTLQIHQMSIKDFERIFPNEDACKTYLSQNRWPECVRFSSNIDSKLAEA